MRHVLIQGLQHPEGALGLGLGLSKAVQFQRLFQMQSTKCTLHLHLFGGPIGSMLHSLPYSKIYCEQMRAGKNFISIWWLPKAKRQTVAIITLISQTKKF